jgi:putative ABC transport system permease protein
MGDLWRDIRISVRVLMKNYRFALVVIFILALAISANSTVFSVVQAVLLRPMPYRDADQLVMIWKTNLRKGLENSPVSYPDYLDFKQQGSSLEAVAAFSSDDFSLTGTGEPLRIAGVSVSDGFFTLLGVPPIHGRTFAPEEITAANAVILSYGLWQRRFGSDAGIIGKAITLNEKSYNVIGVMPKDFRYPCELFEKCDLWVPLALSQDEARNRSAHTLFIIARLKAQVSLAGAQSEVVTIAHRLDQSNQAGAADWSAKITPLRKQFVGDLRTPLIILFGAVGFVMLIACINVANLLLARSAGRQKEMAIRLAIGAGRKRLVR